MSRSDFVDDKIISEIINFAKRQSEIKRIIMFGSRARNDNRARSDYDIAIVGDIDINKKMEIKEYLDETIETLISFDVIFIDELSNVQLLKNIIKDGIVIYE